MLRLENLTHEDIKNYVYETLLKNREFQSLQDAELNLCSSLAEEVVDKAQGVFLWVHLVVRFLLQGVVEGDTTDELYLRLRKMPEELIEFFRYMIMGIKHEHRLEAAALFRVVLEVHSPTVLSLSFLIRALKDTEFWRVVEKPRPHVLKSQISTMARRIESRGKGLLELEIDGAGDLAVDFLHRSARDFLLTPSSQDILGDFYQKDFEPLLFICRAKLAQLQMSDWKLPHDNGRLQRLRREGRAFLEYFRRFETKFNITDVKLMDDFMFVYNKGMGDDQASLNGEYPSTGSSVFLALSWEIKLYALHKINHYTFDLNAHYCHHASTVTATTLLSLCSHGQPILYEAAAALLKRGEDQHRVDRIPD